MKKRHVRTVGTIIFVMEMESKKWNNCFDRTRSGCNIPSP